MKLIIDRFEGDYAVCEREDKTMMDIERSKLPEGAKEGSVLLVDGNNISLDENETLERSKHIKKMMNDLWE